MRIGLALPHYDTSLGGAPATWDGVRRVARLAEASGFDSVWVSDHLFLDWSKYGGPDDVHGALECFTTVSAVAAATDRVRIGTLAACNDLRNPGLVAKMAATVDLLSGGRLELCLGAGWYEPEFRAAGIPFDSARIRIERLGEASEIVRRLLRGEEVTFEGDHYTIDGGVCRPLPRRPPAVWIGGKGNRLIRTAARRADGWNFSWVGSVEGYAERTRYADRACEQAGRDPATLRRSVGVYVLAGTGERDLQTRFERLVQRTPAGVTEAAFGGDISWRAFNRRGIAGTIDEVVDSLLELGRYGAEEVIVAPGILPFQIADESDIELIGELVAPALR